MPSNSALDRYSKQIKKKKTDTRNDGKMTITERANSVYANFLPSQALEINNPTVTMISIDLIRERQNDAGTNTNEFHDQRTDTLEQSIEQNGLMSPIIVVKLPNPDANGKMYQIVSGHRRFRAVRNIYNKWVDRVGNYSYLPTEVEEKINTFSQIAARVFGLDVGQSVKDPSIAYITPAQEHLIYLETNFEARGLTFEDSLLYFEELRSRLKKDPELRKYIEDITYEARKKENPNARKTSAENAEPTYLSYILSEEMQIKGWSRQSVLRYIEICDLNDRELSEQLKKEIRDGKKSIRTAYDQIKKMNEEPQASIQDNSSPRVERYENKLETIKSIGKSVRQKKGTSYSTEQLRGLRAEVKELLAIIEDQLKIRE